MVLFAMFHVLLILFYDNILKPDVAATAFLITNCPIRPDNWQELFSSQRCRRSCLVDSDCKPRHVCICDQECAARCPSLNNTLTNGIVQLPKESKVGSVTRYSCIGNYRLIGSASRVCQGNKQWSGEEPFCLASGREKFFHISILLSPFDSKLHEKLRFATLGEKLSKFRQYAVSNSAGCNIRSKGIVH
ncbi:putative sushi domain protein [Trichinella spiralis]|uniref:putative sushi domain protein n=1 Tax=Trichinella spiralis TaxID=6334 RepID=UPI0001EFC2CC|nr:putative sushi domain protein [Trichinella spiralis]